MDEADVPVDVPTPLGFRVLCSTERWVVISSIKHPPMRGRLADVIMTLADPDEVRMSRYDDDVQFFYRRSGGRWVCAVVRSGTTIGWLLTACPADGTKKGVILWTR